MRLLSAALANKVRIFIYTSTPSVIFNAKGHEGPDETAPLTFDPKYPYPFSKAVAEMAVLSANGKAIRTLALRPHLIWGPGDPHFTPRILTLAKKGKLRLFSGGPYLIDATFIDNAAAAHLAALKVLSGGGDAASDAAGRAYFIGQGETISILDFMNRFLKAANYYPVTAKIPPFAGRFLARATEFFWKCFRLKGEPPITLFSAIELSTSHYFDIGNAKRYLGYTPKVSYEEGFRILSKYFKEGCPFEES
jgi:nucleoside-diphosphate-sugar epimerase